jgi:hypothetical protein
LAPIAKGDGETTMTEGAVPQSTPAGPKPISGLGGWLILPMLGLIASVVTELVQLPDMINMSGQLGAPADPTANTLVQFDMILSVVLYLIAPVALLLLMFGRKRAFPRNYIRWVVASAIYVVFDLFLGYWLSHAALEGEGVGFFNYDFLREILGPLSGLCLWMPYMLTSQRVKNTFVK